MATVVNYADVEAVVKAWLLTTSVAPLVTRGDGGVSIYLAMPIAAPVPAVILSRVGGSPRARKDFPEEVARLTFQCWGTNRLQAGAIARTLIAEGESLARGPGYINGTTLLGAVETLRMFWLPEPDSDTARYIVDALATTVTTT